MTNHSQPEQVAAAAPTSRHGLLSVVVPCFNEEQVIRFTHDRLQAVLERCGLPWEIVYADDGSRDRTGELLDEIAQEDSRVRVVTLTRNFGHQAAASAGLQFARGDAVAVIDADLQDPPEVLLDMIDRWRKGVDVAYGQRLSRAGETFFKLFMCRVFYRLLAGAAEVSVPLDTGDFRLMDRSVVDTIVSMPEQDRFLRGMVAWVGFRQEAVPYLRAPRLAGESKYPFRKLLKLAIDGFVSLSHAPVRALWWITGGLAACCLLCLLGAAGTWIAGFRGSSAFIMPAAIYSAAAANAACLTIVGEYASRIYRQVRGRPLWIIRKTVGGDAAATTQPLRRAA